jgi:hypothetical protein
VEVQRGGRVVGRAICIAPRILLTAAHVVADCDLQELAIRANGSEALTNVIFVKTDPKLDVAVMHVDGDFDVSTVRRPAPGEQWMVPTPSGSSKPDLTGHITSVRRGWRNALGNDVPAIQLEVVQTLQDFSGYSGSGVIADDGSAIGILIEQQPANATRLRSASFANVLYAVSVSAACEALGIEPQRELPTPRAPLPSSMLYHEEVLESLRGYRSRLTSQDLRFVNPPSGVDWSPEALWASLSTQEVGSILLVGHGGVGKTRTLLEVGDLAVYAGWEVIHVRGGNAVRVADAMSERVRDPVAPPVLLMLDYLNLARELDLLALTELANASRANPRLRILGTSRTGWEVRHRQDAGMSRFARVHLNPDESNASAVCLAIVKQIAPVATQKYGAATVLDVTGSRRPILAVLLGQIVEAQVVANGDLPAALVSEDIATWLSERLMEDGILPEHESDGTELPPHMLVAAVCLAAAPAPKDVLVAAVVGAVASVPREHIAVTLERLQRLGWIIESTDGLTPAHDVVVDKILEAAVLHRDTGIVRESALTAVLNTARTSPLVFGNAIASLERVLDERTARDLSSTEVRTYATEWLTESAAAIASPLSEETQAGARVAAQMLESELWSNEVADRWRAVGSDLLLALESSPLAAEPLLVACRSLEKDIFPTIADRAVAWIIRQGSSVDEFVMNACLTRRDVSPDDSALLIGVAVESLTSRAAEVTADFTLRRLLRRADVTIEDLAQVRAYVEIWIEAHGESEHAVHLLSAVVDHHEIRRLDPGTWNTAWELCLKWIEQRPLHADSALALESIIKTDRAELVFESVIWPLTADWLNAHSTDSAAIYVLESLLQVEWLPAARVEEVLAASTTWIDANMLSRSVSFLVKQLVTWEHEHPAWSAPVWEVAGRWLATTEDFRNAAYVLRAALRNRTAADPVSPELWTHVRRWLLRHSMRAEARPLLMDALTWGFLDDGAQAVLWESIEKWLLTHITESHCSYLIQLVAAWPGLDRDRGDRLLEIAAAWLGSDHPEQSKSFVIQATVEYVGITDQDLSEAMWSRIDDWFDSFGDSPAASYVLRKLMQGAQLVQHHGEAVAQRTSLWLAAHPHGVSSVRLVRSVIATMSTARALDVVIPAILSFLDELAPEPDLDTCHLLQELATWESASAYRLTVWGVAGRFLAVDRGKLGGFVVQSMLTDPAEISIPAVGWSAVRSWLDQHSSERQIIHTLLALLSSSRLDADQAADLWPLMAKWLDHNSEDPKSLELARTAYLSEHFGVVPLQSVWPVISGRFGSLATRLGSRHLLERIAQVGLLDDTQTATFWTCASRWLDRFGESLDATFLLQALFQLQSTDVQREILWNHAQRWLSVNNEHWTSAFLLIELIRWDGLDGVRAASALDAARIWLRRNGSTKKARGLVAAIVRSRQITHRQLETFGATVRAWLESQPDASARQEFVRAANSRSVSKNRRAVALAILPPRRA